MRIVVWISNIICVAYIFRAAKYWVQYFNSAQDLSNKELLSGVVFCLMFAFWPALFSAVFAVFKKPLMNKFERAFSISLLPIILIFYMAFLAAGT